METLEKAIHSRKEGVFSTFAGGKMLFPYYCQSEARHGGVPINKRRSGETGEGVLRQKEHFSFYQEGVFRGESSSGSRVSARRKTGKKGGDSRLRSRVIKELVGARRE